MMESQPTANIFYNIPLFIHKTNKLLHVFPKLHHHPIPITSIVFTFTYSPHLRPSLFSPNISMKSITFSKIYYDYMKSIEIKYTKYNFLDFNKFI